MREGIKEFVKTLERVLKQHEIVSFSIKESEIRYGKEVIDIVIQIVEVKE